MIGSMRFQRFDATKRFPLAAKLRIGSSLARAAMKSKHIMSVNLIE
jgi:hypothetical protein